MEAAAAGGSLAFNNEEEEEEAAAVDEYAIASSAVDLMPPGFRFHPTDWEIIDYLLSKVIDRGFRAVAIGDIDLNSCEPWDLPKKAKMKGEKEWFFYFEKITKYPSGMRTNRATPSGYWKATGRDKEIYNNKRRVVGMKKTLVFYRGRAPKGEKMNWVIHEYRLHGDFSAYNLPSDAKEKWVVCRVFHKKINGDDPRPAALQLGRIDSFVDRCLLDSPTPLPPLTDDFDYDDDQFRPAASNSKLIKLQPLDQNNPNLTINQYSMNPNPYYSTQMVHFNSVQQQQQHPYQSLPDLPYQSPTTTINSRINLAADDIYIGGKERIMCKMEMVDCNKLESTDQSKSINESDVDEEISLCFSPNVSLWSY